MTTTLEGVEGTASRLGRSLPLGKNRYPFYMRLGAPQGRSGQVRKISPPTGIRSPDRPARGQSLYRLSYPAHRDILLEEKNSRTVCTSNMDSFYILTSGDRIPVRGLDFLHPSRSALSPLLLYNGYRVIPKG